MKRDLKAAKLLCGFLFIVGVIGCQKMEQGPSAPAARPDFLGGLGQGVLQPVDTLVPTLPPVVGIIINAPPTCTPTSAPPPPTSTFTPVPTSTFTFTGTPDPTLSPIPTSTSTFTSTALPNSPTPTSIVPDPNLRQALMDRNRQLVADAAALLAERLGTDVGSPFEMTGSMALVRLPLELEAKKSEADKVRQALRSAGADSPVHPLSDRLWLRLSAYAYNEMADYERLAELLRDVLKRV